MLQKNMKYCAENVEILCRKKQTEKYKYVVGKYEILGRKILNIVQKKYSKKQTKKK